MKERTRLFDTRSLFTLIIPLIIEQILTTFVGLADSIMVANVGEAAVSGVSLIDNITVLVVCVFSAMATGGAVIAGQYLGQENAEKARKSANELVWLSGTAAVVVMAAVYLAKPFILGVVFGKISPEVYGHANTYLLIVNASVPFIAVYSAGTAIFRAMGNSRVTMFVSMIMNAINITGNAICIYGLKMGSEGVAIPTLLSRIAAAVMIVLLLLNENRDIYIEKTFLHRFSLKEIKRILKIGLPGGLENGMFQLGKVLLLSLVSTFGTAAITANAITNMVASIQVIPGMAISLAITTVVSRCVGAGDFEQARYYTKKLMFFTYSALFIVDALTLIFLPGIINLYGLSAETAEITKNLVWCHAIGAVVIWPVAFDLPATFRAAGDVRYPMVISIISMWAFRLVAAYIFAVVLNMGVLGAWLAMPVDWIFRAIIFIPRYIKGKWCKFKAV